MFKSLVLVVGVSILGHQAFGNAVGTSVFRIEKPKPVTTNLLTARYVLDSDQSLKASCPAQSKLVSVGCSATDTSFSHAYPVNHSVDQESIAQCSVKFMRSDEVVKISMSLSCKSEVLPIVASELSGAN